MTRYLPAGAAVIDGYPAYVLADALRQLSRNRYFDRHSPAQRGEILAAIRALGLAGQAWMAERESVIEQRGTAETDDQADSSCFDQISTKEAGVMLGLTDRMVRNLAARGELPGVLAKDGWRLDRAAVLDLAQRRTEAAA